MPCTAPPRSFLGQRGALINVHYYYYYYHYYYIIIIIITIIYFAFWAVKITHIFVIILVVQKLWQL